MRTAFRKIEAFARRFRRDRGGQIAVTFGLAAIPVMLIVGAAVDYSRAVTQRSNLQQASDAAALAMAHTNLNSTSTTSALSGPTQTYLTGVMNGARLASLALSDNNTTLCIKTTFATPTTIMAIANIKTMNVGASSCATSATGATSEVAVALDNSGSMSDSAGGQSKIAALRIAAQQLVDILNPSGTANPSTSISLVPFTALVNVGSDPNAFFLDKQGKSSIHWQNFHRPAPILPLASFYPTSKLDLFSALNQNPKVAWGGCVEERPVPNITSDTPASSAAPDTLFVPFLSPDDPGDTTINNGCFFITPLTKVVSTSCTTPPAGSGPLNSHYFNNSYLNDQGVANLSKSCVANPLSATYDAMVSPLTPPDGQANVYPLGGETMVCKYNNGQVVSTQVSTNVATGPNYLCSSQQLTPLTTDRSALTTAISTMQAGGSTNLATGFMWAWRTISPTVNPFPVASPATIGQQNPKPYAPANQKVIILMTDGTNSWTSNPYSPWLSTFEAFGYYVNNRIASYGDCYSPGTTVSTDDATTARCQLDNVTLEACTNAKKLNINVYTIGFSTVTNPIDAQGLKLLKSCASTDGNFFQASDSAGIVAAFQQIAQNIKGLRLTQ